jgi:hypothetical protein
MGVVSVGDTSALALGALPGVPPMLSGLPPLLPGLPPLLPGLVPPLLPGLGIYAVQLRLLHLFVMESSAMSKEKNEGRNINKIKKT